MRANNLKLLRLIFEEAGIVFIDENGGGAGARLREPKKQLTYKELKHALKRIKASGGPTGTQLADEIGVTVADLETFNRTGNISAARRKKIADYVASRDDD